MKPNLLARFSLAASVTCLLASSAANATTYYVATTGSDTNPGTTPALPFRSIARGIEAAADFDQILILNGTYIEHNLSLGDKNLEIRSVTGNPADCILDCQNLGPGILIFRGQTLATAISGLTIRNAVQALVVGLSSATVTNCTFSNNRAPFGPAVWFSGDAMIVDRCTFADNLSFTPESKGGALHVSGGDLTLTNSLFSNNLTTEGPSFPGSPPPPFNGRSVTLAPRNGQTVAARITNCTLFGTWSVASAANVYVEGSSLALINSILRGGSSPTSDIYNAGGSVSVSHSNTQAWWPGAGNISIDPQFVSAGSGNYRLQANSLCIDSADAAVPGLPSLDVAGGQRIIGATLDMGAYEFWGPTTGEWYVDAANGNDLNPGSPAEPVATVTRAVSLAANGHGLFIRPGNYGTDRPRITKSLRLQTWGGVGPVRIGQP